MYAPRVIENVTMLTFNVIDFSVITRDAEADAICATLNKFEEALKSRISIYPSFFKVPKYFNFLCLPSAVFKVFHRLEI